MKSKKSQNYYEVLGVSRFAAHDEIRKAYEISKHTFTEDSLATYSLYTETENQEIFSLISRAYETLCNPELRREYDAFLSSIDKAPGKAVADEEQMVAQVMGTRNDVKPPPARGGIPAKPTPPPAEPPPKTDKNDPRIEKFIQSVSVFNGAVIKKIRMLKGFSLEEMAEATKIRRVYLQYLEEENFSALPAPIYVKGFVSIISSLLDLPAQKVSDDYMAHYHANMSE